jgi:hypothetical protein
VFASQVFSGPSPALLASLDEIREIAILCLPGVAAGTRLGTAVLPLAVAAAELLQNRMLIVDPPPDAVLTDDISSTG